MYGTQLHDFRVGRADLFWNQPIATRTGTQHSVEPAEPGRISKRLKQRDIDCPERTGTLLSLRKSDIQAISFITGRIPQMVDNNADLLNSIVGNCLILFAYSRVRLSIERSQLEFRTSMSPVATSNSREHGVASNAAANMLFRFRRPYMACTSCLEDQTRIGRYRAYLQHRRERRHRADG